MSDATPFWRQIREAVNEELDKRLNAIPGLTPGVYNGLTIDRYGRVTLAKPGSGGGIPAGDTFPGGSTGDYFYHYYDSTKLGKRGMLFVKASSAWYSVEPLSVSFYYKLLSGNTESGIIVGTLRTYWPNVTTVAIEQEYCTCVTQVNPTHDGSNYYTITLTTYGPAGVGGSAAVLSFDTSADATSSGKDHSDYASAATGKEMLLLTATPTGTPGDLNIAGELHYHLKVTP